MEIVWCRPMPVYIRYQFPLHWLYLKVLVYF